MADYGGIHYSGHGAQGAQDGGGFMNDNVQSSPAGGKVGYDKETIRPVTIKQILEGRVPGGADFKIDGEPVTQVTFVGQIRSISTQTTNITYSVDDGTSVIDVKLWIDNANNQDEMETDSNKPKLEEDKYCRVHGKPKDLNNKQFVAAHVIRPISDYNEVNYHLLEATAVHLFLTRGPPTADRSDGQYKGQVNTMDGQQDTGVNGGAMPKMSGIATRVYKTLRSIPENNEGLHVQDLASRLGIGINEVYKGAEELVSLGVIFTTVDDDTWALL